jgi:hypothetical protein
MLESGNAGLSRARRALSDKTGKAEESTRSIGAFTDI